MGVVQSNDKPPFTRRGVAFASEAERSNGYVEKSKATNLESPRGGQAFAVVPASIRLASSLRSHGRAEPSGPSPHGFCISSGQQSWYRQPVAYVQYVPNEW